MDRFLAGPGYWVAAAVAFFGTVYPADREDRPLWLGFAWVAGAVAWTLWLRGDEIRRDIRRAGRPLSRPRAAVRAWVGRLRWLLAVAYAAAAAWYARSTYDTGWFTVVAAVVTFAAVGYATRPLPPAGASAGVAGDAGDDRGQLLRS